MNLGFNDILNVYMILLCDSKWQPVVYLNQEICFLSG